VKERRGLNEKGSKAWRILHFPGLRMCIWVTLSGMKEGRERRKAIQEIMSKDVTLYSGEVP
jgi:hypothetical protein